MPRINIDDRFYSDERFYHLIELVKDYDLAVGISVRFWKLGQRYFKDNKSIPPSIFFKQKYAKEFLEVGLAKRQKRGLYICGSRDHFAWIQQKVDAAHNSWKSRRNKNGPALRNDAGAMPPAPALDIFKVKGVDSITLTKLTRQEIEEQKKKMFELFGD